jgi:hypothetical protein
MKKYIITSIPQNKKLNTYARGGEPGDKYFKYQNTQYKKDPQGNWYKWNGKSWSAAGYGDSAYDLDQHISLQDWEQAGRFQADDANWSNDKPKATTSNYETERNKVLNSPLATTQQKIKATQAPLKSNVDLNKKLVEQKQQEDYLAEQNKLRELQEEQRRKEEEEARLLNPNFYNSETLPAVARQSGALLTEKEEDDFEAHKKDLGQKYEYLAKDQLDNNYVRYKSEYKNNAKATFQNLEWDQADKLATLATQYNTNVSDADIREQFPKATDKELSQYKDFINSSSRDLTDQLLGYAHSVDLTKALKKTHWNSGPNNDQVKALDPNDPNHIELSGRMPGTVGEWGTRIADVIANPLDAIHYGMSPTEEMPMNMYEYEKAKQQIGFEDGADLNAVNSGLDFASWFHPVGMYAQGMKMIQPTGESLVKFAQDPSWGGAGNAALNIGMNALAFYGAKSPFKFLAENSAELMAAQKAEMYDFGSKLNKFNRETYTGPQYYSEQPLQKFLPLGPSNAPISGTVLKPGPNLLPTISQPHVVTESPLTTMTPAVEKRGTTPLLDTNISLYRQQPKGYTNNYTGPDDPGLIEHEGWGKIGDPDYQAPAIFPYSTVGKWWDSNASRMADTGVSPNTQINLANNPQQEVEILKVDIPFSEASKFAASKNPEAAPWAKQDTEYILPDKYKEAAESTPFLNKPASSIDDVAINLESQIANLKQQEVLNEESRKVLWADYKAGKITGEEYNVGAKKLNPNGFDNPRYELEKQLREHKVKQDISNTPQQNILQSEEQLGKNISDGGTNNKGVFELGDNYVARLSAHGYDDASRLVTYADKIKSPRTGKTLQVKEIDGKVYQVQNKVTGTPITQLSETELQNVPKKHIDNFWKDKAELDGLGLSIDISGGKSNIFYDPKKGFQIIDLGIGESSANEVIAETYKGLKLPSSVKPVKSKYNISGATDPVTGDAKKQFLKDLQEDGDYNLFKENAKIKDPQTGAWQSSFGVPNVQDDFFKGQGLSEENSLSGISGATDPITGDVINFSKDDNQIVSDIINDVRERKIGLWQTPEGQSRLQKMIDNTPSLKGQTPESMIEGVASMTNLNNIYASKLTAKESIELQMLKVDSLHDQGLITDTDYFNQSAALDEELKTVELSIAESEETLNKNYGFYSAESNTMGIQPGAWKNEDIAKIGSHEFGHILGSFGREGKVGTTYLDDKLKTLKLLPDSAEQLKIEFPNEAGSKLYTTAYNVMGEGRDNYQSKTKKYFEEGSGGTERVPMVSEVREDMLDKGIIKSEYDKITPKMLKDHYKDYKKTRGEKYPLRIYDVIKNDSENFNIMSEVLNALPMISVAATVYDQLDGNDDNSVTEASMLGLIGLIGKKPGTFKMPKRLQGIVNDFKKYGNGALTGLRELDVRYIKKETQKLLDEFAKTDVDLGYIYGKPGLYQEQGKLEGLINTRNDKFKNFFRDRELVVQGLDPKSSLAKYLFPEAEARVKLKQFDVDQYNKAADVFKVTPEGLESNKPSVFEGVTTTGEKTITDLSTGEKVKAEVKLPGAREEYKVVDGDLVKTDTSINTPIISTEYVTALKNSRNDVETKIPGAKVFGSSVLVTEAGMPHITGDIDVLISQSDYNKNVKNNFPFVQDYGPAKQHSVYKDYGQEGVLDFNIIHEDANGKVIPYYNPDIPDKTPTEIELFRQFYPDKFQEASAKAATTGKPLEINMSSKEFMAGIDPQVKTVIDSYETSPFNKWGLYNANKEKHILRPDVLIAYGKPEVVAKGQEAYIKSIVGHKGNLGHQFSEQALSDVNKNVEALVAMNFKGDNVLQVAQDPKRMQLAINDYYINNTVFSREISEYSLPGRKYKEDIIKTALTEWFPGKGASYNGIGLNTVQKGNPNHIMATDNPIIGHRQIGLKLDTNDPVSYVNSIVRGTSGNYVFTPEEFKFIEELADKYIPEVRSQMPSNFKARDILNLQPNLPFTNKPKEFLDELSQKTGIRAIRKDEDYGGYGIANASYASLLGKFDETVDAMMYSLKKYHASPKTANERKKAFDKQESKQSTAERPPKIETVKDFKKLYGVLNGGLASAEARLVNYTDQLAALNSYKDNLISKMSDKNSIYLKEVNTKIETVTKRRKEIVEQKEYLDKKLTKARDLYKGLGYGVLAIAGVGVGVAGLNYAETITKRQKDKIKEAIKRNEELKNRGIKPEFLHEYLPDVVTDYIRKNPSAKHWPTGEKIEVTSDSNIVRPMSTTLKKGNVVWDMKYRDMDTKLKTYQKNLLKLNKKSLGGENEMELELTQKEIDDLVSRGYVVIQK